MLKAVGAIIRDGQGRVLIQRNNKIGKWCIPSGKVEANEANVYDAMVREVYEETHLKINSAHLVGKKTFTYGEIPVESYVYEVTNYTGKPVNAEPAKHSIQEFMHIKDIKKLPGPLSDITRLALG